MERNKLIAYYKKRLKTVKKMWPLDSEYIDKERSKEYIDHAKNELKEVKNGRNW